MLVLAARPSLHTARLDALMSPGVLYHSPRTAVYLFEMGVDIHPHVDRALEQAAQVGDLSAVEYYVKRGADPSQWFSSAMMRAAMNGHLAVVQYLVEFGTTWGQMGTALVMAA